MPSMAKTKPSQRKTGHRSDEGQYRATAPLCNSHRSAISGSKDDRNPLKHAIGLRKHPVPDRYLLSISSELAMSSTTLAACLDVLSTHNARYPPSQKGLDQNMIKRPIENVFGW